MAGFSSAWPQLESLVSDLGDGIIDQAASIASDVQSSIADAFGATANIDRQKIANIKAVAQLRPGQQAGVQSQINAAEQIALTMNDPQQGAEFFKLRSKQLIELGKLNDAINATSDEKMRAQLQAEYNLVNAAQQAELKQFDAKVAAGNATQDIATKIQQLLSGIDLGILDNPVIAQLSNLLGQLRAPAAPATGYNGVGGTSNFNQNTTLNMPVYTNMSPTAIQSSMAIAGAALF